MRVPPAVVLFFLSPVVAELLSGSAPPTEFFNPVGFFILASLYGSGAILVREMNVQWGKGFVSLLMLGAAYGIVEEGLMVKSFFDPGWVDLGILGVFGRWAGVNWVWVEWLTIYHAVFSIAIPVKLVELAYPTRRNQSWVGRRALRGFTFLLAGVVLLGYFALTKYQPPLPQYVLAVLTTIAFVISARKLPSSLGRRGTKPLTKPLRLGAASFLATTGLFLIFGAAPHFLPSPPAVMILGLLLAAGFLVFVKRYRWNAQSDYHRFALIAGALAFFILLAPLQELDTTRIDDPRGMSLVGLAFLIGLVVLGRKIRRRISAESGSSGNSG